jgi:hypothetical protein
MTGKRELCWVFSSKLQLATIRPNLFCDHLTMGYAHLFDERDLALLHDWLQQTGELYMDLNRPHSGGDNRSVYFISSLAQIKEIVSAEKHREVSITIFREKQYPIRGVADEKLMKAAMRFLPDGQWFSIVSLGNAPSAQCNIVGFGDTHAELQENFVRLEGQSVRFGRNPFDLRNSYFEQPDNAWVVNSYLYPPRVTKNWPIYLPFETEPNRYRQIICW